MPILGYPARPEHDQPPAGAVVFGVPSRSPEPSPVPLHLLADFPPVFLDHVRSGDWPLYALPFEGAAYAVVCWAEIKRGECPVFFVHDSLIEGSAAVRAALRVLVDRVLDTDTEAEHACYMRLPEAVAPGALATAQRAEWHVDVSDDELTELAARAEYDEPLADWERELLALPLAAAEAAESGVLL